MGLSSIQRTLAANRELLAIDQVDQIEAGQVPIIKYDDTYALHDELFVRKFFLKTTESRTNRDFYSGRTYTTHSECKRAKKCFSYQVNHGNNHVTLNTWMYNDIVPRIQTIEMNGETV